MGALSARFWIGLVALGSAWAGLLGCAPSVHGAAPARPEQHGTVAPAPQATALAQAPTPNQSAPAAEPGPASEQGAAGHEAASLGPAPNEPAAAASPPETSPRLPAESIRRVVRWNVGRFRDCYQRALVASPKLEGRVGVRFWIDAAGQARDARVEASSLPEPVAACIAGAFSALRFPAIEGGPIGVRYGFVLGSEAATAHAAPTGETLRANRLTPSDDPTEPGAAADAARSRLFRVFLAGLEQGPSAPSIDPAAAVPSSVLVPIHPTTPDASADQGQGSGAPSGTPQGASRCGVYDPLCDEL